MVGEMNKLNPAQLVDLLSKFTNRAYLQARFSPNIDRPGPSTSKHTINPPGARKSIPPGKESVDLAGFRIPKERVSDRKKECLFCQASTNWASRCPKANSTKALKIAEQKRLCHNCLGPGHTASNCKLLASLHCSRCSSRHAIQSGFD